MARARIEIDGDIARAETLPAAFYSDVGWYEAAKERIFARSWQFAADRDVVRLPRSAWPFALLEGCLDEPLVLTRDEGDRAHCLSNVCTHRGNLVVESGGVCAHLRCRYHGRRFDLCGAFRDMPEFEEAKGFPMERDDLKRMPLAEWHRFLFAGIAPMGRFEEWIGPMAERMGWLGAHPEEFVFEPSRSRDYLVRANWALYVDNYLEGFHIPFVHAGLAAALDYGAYTTELFKWSSLQLGVAKEGEDCFELPGSSPDCGKRIAGYYWWLFPNTMFNFYPWGLSINIVRPLGVALTKVSYLTYVRDATRLGLGAGAELDRVEREDEAIVETVQRGVRSRVYDRGRYSPTREQGVHHFHRLIAECVNGEG